MSNVPVIFFNRGSISSEICSDIVNYSLIMLSGVVCQADIDKDEYVAQVMRLEERYIRTAQPDLWHIFPGFWFLARVRLPEADPHPFVFVILPKDEGGNNSICLSEHIGIITNN